MTPSSSLPHTADAGVAAQEPALSRLDEVRRAFLGLEAELGLFAWTAGGARVWDYLRVEVFDSVIAELGLLGEKQAPSNRSLAAYLANAPGIMTSLVRRNPFLCRRVELLFLGHPRRRLEPDGTWWDAYSDPLVDALGRKSLLIERPYQNRHLQPARTSRIAHLDALALAAAARRRVLPGEPFSALEGEELDRLAGVLSEVFDVRIAVRGMARAKLKLRRSQLPLWCSLLRRLKPRAMCLVVSYGNEIPIEACQQLGIPTIELQHGVISRQNLGYHFPLPHCRKQLFPDWLFTFGDFWRGAASFPIPVERVVSVGYPYLEERRSAFAGVARRRRVLFLSQRSIGAALSRIAAQVARRPGHDVEVLYKLHPGERATWRHDYPWLAEAPVRILDGDEPHLYELFTGCRWQVGVYSTALFEGLAFGLETRIVRLPGHEAMRDLVDGTGAASWVDDADDIVFAMQSGDDGTGWFDSGFFFRPGAIHNARRALANALS